MPIFQRCRGWVALFPARDWRVRPDIRTCLAAMGAQKKGRIAPARSPKVRLVGISCPNLAHS